MSKFFKLRTTHKDVSFEDTLVVIESVCAATGTFAYAHEGGDDNPHVHWYLETLIKAPAVRSRLRKLQEGNRFYSLKELDEQYPLEYLSYMMKEGNFNFDRLPRKVIEDVKARQEEVVNEMKEKKKAKKKVIDIIMCLIEEEYPGKVLDSPSYLKLISPIVLKYHIDKGLVIRPGAIEALTLTAILRHSHSAQEEFLKTVNDKVHSMIYPIK